MLSWSLGGYPSPNLLVAERFARDPAATPDAVLDAIAADRYGPGQVPKVRAAWKAFSTAFREFPYDGAVLYQAPQQFGPANLLFARPTGYHATMVGFPYDDLNGWRGPYPAEVFARQFGKVATGWRKGIIELTGVKERTGPEDMGLALAADLHFASTANQALFILARDAGRRDEMALLARAEVQLARALYDLTLQDSRIGFESSNQYYYVPLDLVEKVVNCESIVAGLAAGSKAP
jgi:hypothetical protein